jgi:hypothetical protein
MTFQKKKPPVSTTLEVTDLPVEVTPAVEPVPVVVAPKPTHKILPHDFRGADFDIKQYSVNIRAGVPFDVIKDNPSTWAHVANKLADGDVIHVRTEDRAYYARLLVLSVTKQSAKTYVLEYHDLPRGVAVPKGYVAAWGGREKWRVMRVADNAVMASGFPTEAEAAAHAEQIAKSLAA